MEISFTMKIQKAVITVNPREAGAIKAFAEVHFMDEQNQLLMKVKGITVKLKQFSDYAPKLGVDFPAFPSKKSKTGHITSFILEDKTLWRYLTEEVLTEYRRATGDQTPSMYLNETVNPDEIPI